MSAVTVTVFLVFSLPFLTPVFSLPPERRRGCFGCVCVKVTFRGLNRVVSQLNNECILSMERERERAHKHERECMHSGPHAHTSTKNLLCCTLAVLTNQEIKLICLPRCPQSMQRGVINISLTLSDPSSALCLCLPNERWGNVN